MNRNLNEKKQQEFWDWFNSIASEMPWREISLRKCFTYLDTRPDPITIVETGCARSIGNWQEDGSSTLLWDRYVQSRSADSHVYSVDINENTVASCRAEISPQVTLTCGDSVSYLNQLEKTLDKKISLLYLDSFDIDWLDLVPSALHHLKELTAIRSCLDPNTLVMLDDAPIYTHITINDDGKVTLVGDNRVGGKGRFVGSFAKDINAKLMWCHYQTAWTGMD